MKGADQHAYNVKSDQHLLCSWPRKYTVNFLNFRTPENGCNLPKIQTNRPNFRVFRQKDADLLANSEYPDQTAPLGAV